MPFQCSKCDAVFKTQNAFIRHIGRKEPCWTRTEKDITIDVGSLYTEAEKILELLDATKLTSVTYPSLSSNHQRLKCTIIPKIRAGVRLLDNELRTDEINTDLERLEERSAKFARLLHEYRKGLRRILDTRADNIETPDNGTSSDEESRSGSDE